MTWNPDYNPPTAQRTSKPLPRLASETTADNPWPVSLLSEKFYTAVERWPSVWVAGQITQINTRRQGSAYITLRDDQIRRLAEDNITLIKYSELISNCKRSLSNELALRGKSHGLPYFGAEEDASHYA